MGNNPHATGRKDQAFSTRENWEALKGYPRYTSIWLYPIFLAFLLNIPPRDPAASSVAKLQEISLTSLGYPTSA
jgi:hypothetical protein